MANTSTPVKPWDRPAQAALGDSAEVLPHQDNPATIFNLTPKARIVIRLEHHWDVPWNALDRKGVRAS